MEELIKYMPRYSLPLDLIETVAELQSAVVNSFFVSKRK